MAHQEEKSLPKRILVIDEDVTVARLLEQPLAEYGIEVVGATDLSTAMLHFQNSDFEVVFVELEFSELPGLALIQRLRESDEPDKRSTGFVAMSGKVRTLADDILIKRLLEIQVILKPFTIAQVLSFLSRGVHQREALKEFELFKYNMIESAFEGQIDSCINEIKKLIPKLGHQAIKLACDIYEKTGRYKEGLHFVKSFSEVEAEPILLKYLRCKFLIQLEQYRDAFSQLEDLYRNCPSLVAPLQDLVSLCLRLGEADKGVVYIKRLLSLTPDNNELKFKYIDDYIKAGYVDQACLLGREVLDPLDVVRHFNTRGVQLCKEGDIKQALIEYNKALMFFPDFVENYRIHYNISLAQMRLKLIGYEDQARESLLKCLRLNPNFEKASEVLKNLEPIRLPKAS